MRRQCELCLDRLLAHAVQAGQCICVRAAGREHASREERARSGADTSTSGRPAVEGWAKVSSRARHAAARGAAGLRAEAETAESPKGVLVGASEPAARASELSSSQSRDQHGSGAQGARTSAGERASSGGALPRLAAGSEASQQAQPAPARLEDTPGATGSAVGASLRRPIALAPADAVRCLPQDFVKFIGWL